LVVSHSITDGCEAVDRHKRRLCATSWEVFFDSIVAYVRQ